MIKLLENKRSYGIRDPHPLVDNTYTPINIEGKYLLYFNERNKNKDSFVTMPKVAVSKDCIKWKIQRDPVLVDGNYCAMGSTLRINGRYIIYYASDVKKGFKYSISSNPFKWDDPLSSTYFLKPSQFKNIKYMGLPYVSYIKDHYYCSFEGMTNTGFKIFMASSTDGKNWDPLNNGNYVYEKKYPFECGGQGNPSFYFLNDKYFLFYNGFDKIGWSINYGTSKHIDGTYTTHSTPLIKNDKSNRRVEGARLINKKGTYKMMYFICPTKDSYAESKIYETKLDDKIFK